MTSHPSTFPHNGQGRAPRTPHTAPTHSTAYADWPDTASPLTRRTIVHAAAWAAPAVAATTAAPAIAASAPASPMIIRALAPTGPDIPNTSNSAPAGTKVYSEDNPREYPIHFHWRNDGKGPIPPGQLFTVSLGKNYYRESFQHPTFTVSDWPKIARNPRFTPATAAEGSMFEVVSSAGESLVLRNRETIAPGATADATVTWAARTPTASQGFYRTAFVASSQITTDSNPSNATHSFDSGPFYVEHDPVAHPADIALRAQLPERPEETGFYSEAGRSRNYNDGALTQLTIKGHWRNDGPDPLHIGQIFVVRRGAGLVRGGNSPYRLATPVNTVRNPQFIDTPESRNARFAVISRTESEIRLENRAVIQVGEEITAAIRWTVDRVPADAADGDYGNQIEWSTETSDARVNREHNRRTIVVTSATFRKATPGQVPPSSPLPLN